MISHDPISLNEMIFEPPVQQASSLESVQEHITDFFCTRPISSIVGSVGLGALAALGTSYAGFDAYRLPVGLLAATPGTYKWLKEWGHIPKTAIDALIGWGNTGDNPKIFTPMKVYHTVLGEKKLLGELEYKRSYGVENPYLTTYTTDPETRGRIRGYTHAKEIKYFYYKLLVPMLKILDFESGDFSGKELNAQLEKFHIPKRFKKEISGIIEGIHQYYHDRGLPPPDMTNETLKKLVCFTCIRKKVFYLPKIFSFLGNLTPGCSTGVYKKNDEEPILFTSQEWIALNMMLCQHTHVYPIKHKTTQEVWWVRAETFPAYPGILRGENDQKVKLAMNEADNWKNDHGIPYGIAVAEMLENNSSAEEIERKFQNLNFQTDNHAPASSYSLTVADKITGFVIQVKPLLSFRYLKNGVVLATNHFLKENGEVDRDSISDGTSVPRYRDMSKVAEKAFHASPQELCIKILKKVNRFANISSALFQGLQVDDEGKPNAFMVAYSNSRAASRLPDSSDIFFRFRLTNVLPLLGNKYESS